MIKDKLISILVSHFDDVPEAVRSMPYSTLRMGAFDEWDSLGNLNLLLAVEAEFSIRFSSEELASLQSLEDIEKFLVTNLKRPGE